MIELGDPLVSLVVASYNHRRYIEKAIRSLKNQTYPSCELIVIDDGSTDGSAELLEKLREKYNFRLVIRKNGGLVSVINTGIAEAKGEFIVFHASDDESMPHRVAEQLRVLKRYPNAAFVSANVAIISEDGRDKGTLLKLTGHERELGFDDVFLKTASLSSVASMYRTAALRKMGQIDEAYLAEDPQIFLRLTWIGYSWVQWAGPPVIAYRMLFSSMSRTKLPLLLREDLRLFAEFSTHPYYQKAVSLKKTSLISALAEIDKRAAVSEMVSGGFNVFSKGFVRAFGKLLLPRKWHYVFKRAGKPS